MKNYFNVTLLFLFITCVTGFAQVNFEKGYIINNQGEQTNCFVKNVGWRFNPIAFSYKLSENAEVQIGSLEEFKEFGVFNVMKYRRFTVDMDRSFEKLDLLSTSRAPEFKSETLYLKVLVEGEKELYSYTESSLVRYFYNEDSNEATQLVFKTYEVTGKYGDKYFAKNNMYQQQLFNNVNCGLKAINKFSGVLYSQKSLTKVFTNYNKCKGIDVKEYDNGANRDWFNLRARPRINFSSFLLDGPYSTYLNDIKFENQSNVSFGVEAEFILPFNNNKWSIIIEPSYHYFKSEKEVPYYNTTVIAVINYSTIELPFGGRYRMFLNEKNNIFFNAQYIFEIAGDSHINTGLGKGYKVSSGGASVFGVGYEFLNKFSLEFRIQQPKNLLAGSAVWTSTYNTSSIIVGYKLF